MLLAIISSLAIVAMLSASAADEFANQKIADADKIIVAARKQKGVTPANSNIKLQQPNTASGSQGKIATGKSGSTGQSKPALQPKWFIDGAMGVRRH